MKETIKADESRRSRLCAALSHWQLDALICARPDNVLLLSGYWPVTATAMAVITCDGRTAVIAPEDELEMAGRSRADFVIPFSPGSLESISPVIAAIREALLSAADKLQLRPGRIGYEAGAASVPVTYAAVFLPGNENAELISHALPTCTLIPADEMLAHLRARPTPAELDRIRLACHIAGQAFQSGAGMLRTGLEETQAAALFRAPLSSTENEQINILRADGFTFCMSGANAARAFAAYQISSRRKLQPGDLVLLHCNSYVDGFWTDITRTFCLGAPNEQQRAMYEAVFAARAAALEIIRPGVRAADVDRAAREVMKAHGFGEAFKHPTGHGVGFAAIDHNAPPRLHPQSDDVLAAGMVCNVEPGIYFEGLSGMRHCEMVAVTESGAEVLTPFLTELPDLMIPVSVASVSVRERNKP